MNDAIFFGCLMVAFLVVQAFFSMSEMACVSFNKVRLHYYVSKEKKRAIWLARLMQSPARFFATTLIGVNACLQFGSESARRFYSAIGLNPDFAPISQVFLVLIFAELAPLIAARRHSEHVAMITIPVIYLCARILSPIIWLLRILSNGIKKIFRIKDKGNIYHLSREEIQKALEKKDAFEAGKEFDPILANIFLLREKTAKDLMIPIGEVRALSIDLELGIAKEQIRASYTPYAVVYQGSVENVVGLLYSRDLLRSSNIFLKELLHSTWFITESNSLYQILKQFRWNNQSLSIVLDENGFAKGILTLDRIMDEVFSSGIMRESVKSQVILERAFTGSTVIEEINEVYGIGLESYGKETLEELMVHRLGHLPVVGEFVRIDGFELIAEEVTLLEIEKIRLRTLTK